MIRSGRGNRSRRRISRGLAESGARHLDPVAVGERLCGKMEFAAVLAGAGVRIVQPALGRAGGGSGEGRKIRAFWPKATRAQIAPHLYGRAGGMGGERASGRDLPQPADGRGDRDAFHKALVRGRPQVEEGFRPEAPTAPGLGIELDDAVAAAHAYAGDRLHLEMQEAPCDWKTGNAFAGGAAGLTPQPFLRSGTP